MFYGMLNIPKLAKLLPFPAGIDSIEANLLDLESKAYPLTCHNYRRVYGSRLATIQPDAGAKIETFAVYLTAEQAEFTDDFEDIKSNYYNKVEVPVVLHLKDGVEVETTAKVYVYSEETVQQEINSKQEHSNDAYVLECANSDYMHFKLRGLPDPEEISVAVCNIGDCRLLRVVSARVDQLDGLAYDEKCVRWFPTQ